MSGRSAHIKDQSDLCSYSELRANILPPMTAWISPLLSVLLVSSSIGFRQMEHIGGRGGISVMVVPQTTVPDLAVPMNYTSQSTVAFLWNEI